jgi:hypothetical protein
MSLRPQVCPTVPEETVRIARASFPKGSRYMRLRDELGAVLGSPHDLFKIVR